MTTPQQTEEKRAARTSTLVAIAAALVLVAGGAIGLTAPPVAHAAKALTTDSVHVQGLSVMMVATEGDCVTVYPGPPPGASVDPDCVP